ncbi:sulfite exporter TauE/SafE family protein [Bifidobacterium vespertilionis]|uniref:Probable membrane transporter protein n=2 Tax=Bifidobacterium vespertilionis TaxID=2562524 RepID=A0A5J5DW00_9BIFI|nr:sulfite exporter TauE/SafE family protein [Bifidobacterium vespertilionis]KAA8823669.1 sulfite exporter TauE/SafE family protein [Bifidobacterium vespertilionis]MBT1178899.1 sulfite exporter TauE/SafE family protein [Bifidobacterium vespertilionis]
MREVSTMAQTAQSVQVDEENNLDESPRGIAVLVVVGVLVGILSGLFGIGGGTVIVPALVWLGLTQRHAAATSMLAIVPTSISGVVSYASNGNVDWIAALLLFIGMFFGGQIGSWLLSRLPELVLRWVFVAFLVFVIVNQLIFTPSRDSAIDMNVVTGISLVAMGLVIGVLAGLLGIGGGALAVPALSIIFAASDLIARGTSLLAMFPNAITTTVANVKRRMVHFKAGLIIGIVAACITPFGTWIAGAVSPVVGQYLFAAYLGFLLIRSFYVAMQATKKVRKA